jgi:hypothetical protein
MEGTSDVVLLDAIAAGATNAAKAFTWLGKF